MKKIKVLTPLLRSKFVSDLLLGAVMGLIVSVALYAPMIVRAL